MYSFFKQGSGWYCFLKPIYNLMVKAPVHYLSNCLLKCMGLKPSRSHFQWQELTSTYLPLEKLLQFATKFCLVLVMTSWDISYVNEKTAGTAETNSTERKNHFFKCLEYFLFTFSFHTRIYKRPPKIWKGPAKSKLAHVHKDSFFHTQQISNQAFSQSARNSNPTGWDLCFIKAIELRIHVHTCVRMRPEATVLFGTS